MQPACIRFLEDLQPGRLWLYIFGHGHFAVATLALLEMSAARWETGRVSGLILQLFPCLASTNSHYTMPLMGFGQVPAGVAPRDRQSWHRRVVAGAAAATMLLLH